MDKQKAIIFMLVGVMLFSVFGLGLVLVLDDSSNELSQDDLDTISQQADQISSAEELAAQEALAAQLCQPLANDPTATALPTPEAFTVGTDVTELAITDLTEGTGKAVASGDCIVAHYHGTLAADGTVFDSSYERGQPARFPLDNLIEGWKIGLVGLKEGGIRRLVIPSEQGYGEAGSPPIIGPNTDLVFVVELIRIEDSN